VAARVAAAVDGSVLAARVVDGGLWVVGGRETNRYDMHLLAGVFDLGGNDRYNFSAPAEAPYQIVIDAAGDDVYESTAELSGPASAVFAVAVLEDRAGDDRYISNAPGSIAAALFGVAVLIDEAGDDRYSNVEPAASWAEGAGMYGAGLLLDRGGDDLYDGQILTQGVGGPGGLGLIVDASGADTYVANGAHFRSAYGTPGVFAGLAQGFGVGIRDIAAGGIGAVYDLAGDDFYSAGEFGQGTGYFQALGILHDAAGDDRYVGSRYAQGSGVHQAAGIIIDDGGRDTYVCSGPAAQGAAWDESIGMLIDHGGDDTYVASDLAQGSAAQQAIGVLVDLGGEDSYACAGACQGRGAGNGYHYDSARVFSFSALLRRGGHCARDPGEGTRDRLDATGTFRADDPGASACCGLFACD
jgi:hypothetical protein